MARALRAIESSAVSEVSFSIHIDPDAPLVARVNNGKAAVDMRTIKSAIKLSNANLSQLGYSTRIPTYDRSELVQHTVHMGVGGFHRAHQAVYLDDLLSLQDTERWGECGLGVLEIDSKMRDALKGQDCLYTVVERSAETQTARVIGSIADYIYAPESCEAAIEKMAAPETRIVSLTITEGGYFIDDGTGEFASEHADIQHDLHNPENPVSSMGYIAAALNRRRQRGLPPFTVMSCDNLQGNGRVAKKVLLAFAELQNPELARWMADHVAFPSCMVDRITPTTTAGDCVFLKETFDLDDAWPVVTEPFIQWVIEDEFCNGRPQWERAGAQLVSDVAPYELMKMRLLNASHSAMGYLGALAGYTYVHEAVQDPLFKTFIEQFMEEATPVVPEIPGTSVAEYKGVLIHRFSNPTIKDQLARICSEGSAKMPKFVLASISELLKLGRSIDLLSLVVAGWIYYLKQGVDERGKVFEIVDAHASELTEAARSIGTDPRPVLAIHSIFGQTLPATPTFVEKVEKALQMLAKHGTAVTMRRYFSNLPGTEQVRAK